MKTITKTCILCILFAITACINNKKPSTKGKSSCVFPPEMVEFAPNRNNPVFTGTGTETWDKKIRERGYILFENNLYKMWYTGYNEIDNQKYLGYATSTDGINWGRYSDRPIFNEKWTEDMFVFMDGGSYYMYAEGKNDIAHLLVSEDGINWQEKGDLQIYSVTGKQIESPYGTPTVWVEDGKWFLFYERRDAGIWLAESGDKIKWVNLQDEPVLGLGPKEYDIAAIAANQVVKYKGCYYLYYHATSDHRWANSQVLWSSNVAMSTDLIHWIKYPGNPVVEVDHSSPILVFDGEKPSLYTMHSDVWRFDPKY